MVNRKMLALGGGLLLGAAGVVNAEAPAADLSSEVAALKTRIAELEGKQGKAWMNEQRAEEVKALVRDVLADADTRASLAASGMTAGHNGKHFFLASEDGMFTMNISGILQVRYTANLRKSPDDSVSDDPDTDEDETAANTQDETENGFGIRRAKLQFDGTIGSPKFMYKLRLSADRNEGTVAADIATIGYQLADNLTVSGGRYKNAFTREEVVSDSKGMAAERSVSNAIFSSGYVEGIIAEWKPTDMVRVIAGVNDGFRSGNVEGGSNSLFTNGAGAADFNGDGTDIAATGRVEVLLMGDWKQGEDFTHWSNDPTYLMVGAAAHWENGESVDGSAPGAKANLLAWTADASFKTAGWSIFGSASGLNTSRNADVAGSTGDQFAAYAFLGQVSYNINDKIEPFARYEYITVDNDAVGGAYLNVITAGANYYFIKHNAKFTLDVVWALDPVTSANTAGQSLSGLGLLTDDSDKENQIAIRAQFQLLF